MENGFNKEGFMSWLLEVARFCHEFYLTDGTLKQLERI